MATISSTGKVGYIYDQPTDTWHPLAGNADTSADYSWTGDHEFSGTGGTSFVTAATFSDTVVVKDGINNFQNFSAVSSAIPSPATGTVVFVRQLSDGSPLNNSYFWNGSDWQSTLAASFSTVTSGTTLAVSTMYKTIIVNTTSNIDVSIPLDTNDSAEIPVGARFEVVRANTGEVTIAPAVGVTLRSKNNYTKIGATYSGAMLTKLANNEWLLIGDLKA